MKMKYAVIASGGKQYKISEGDIIEVDRLDVKLQSEYVFPQVLLFVDEATTQIGKPYVENVSAIGTVLEEKKGEKIRVAKFKAKARYRRVTGFRALLTKIQIKSLTLANIKKEKEIVTEKEEKQPKK